MRNKLPILLAVILAVIAVSPWLRSHQDWCRYMPLLQQTTVPPPNAIECDTRRRQLRSSAWRRAGCKDRQRLN